MPETKEFLFEKIISEDEMRIFGKSRCTLFAKDCILRELSGVLERNGVIQFRLRNKGHDFVYMGRVCVVVPAPEFPKKEGGEE